MISVRQLQFDGQAGWGEARRHPARTYFRAMGAAALFLFDSSAVGGAAETAIDPATFDLATFKCPNWLPSEEVYKRIAARPNLTVAVVSKAREHKPFSSSCIDDRDLCSIFIQRLQYSFGSMAFLANGQNIKKGDRFVVVNERDDFDPGKYSEMRFDPSKRYLIISSSLGLEGRGEFFLNAACEIR